MMPPEFRSMDNENKIKEEALKSFVSYVEVVQKTVREIVDGGSLIILGPLHPRHFLDVLNKLEKSTEFISMGTIFSKAYGGSGSDSAIGRLQNYFRRSRLYLDIINGNPCDINAHFEELWASFNERKIKKITIRPINNVEFTEKLIDFGKFKIQKFSKGELDSLLEQEVCEAFYPYAVVDTKTLSLFWHIIEECNEEKEKENLKIINVGITYDDIFRVKRSFPDRTLQLLALFDWGNASARPSPEKKNTDWGFEPLDLPFRYTVSNDLINSPMASPDLSKLMLLVDETEGEFTQFTIHLTNSDIGELKKVVKNANDFLESIDLQKCDWEFLEIAMGSLAKAFLSDGIEQLLWHMIALEAIIGEEKETTQNIGRRLGLIWGGREKKDIDRICKEFKELYDFRCSLVHGSKFGKGKMEKELYRYHLRLARDYARKTVLWFICYLSHIHRELKKGAVPLNKYPKQKDLLLLLDYQIQSFEHQDAKVMMPEDFPEISFEG